MRNYGIDLLRIVAMFMVAILHVLGQGGVLKCCEALSINYEIGWLLEIGAYGATNVYALISGYVGIERKFKYTDIIKIYLQVIFYTVLVSVLFYFIVPDSVELLNIWEAFFPFVYGNFYGQYWYFTAYFCMFFFIPFMNQLVHSMNREQGKAFVITVFIIFTALPTIFQKELFGTAGGYNVLWIGMLYLLGATLKHFKFGERYGKRIWLMVYLGCVFITWGVKFVFEYYTGIYQGQLLRGSYLVKYTSPTILMAAIALVLLFSKMELGRGTRKLVKFFSPLAFSVYLIHVEPLIWNYFMKDRFMEYASYTPVKFTIFVVGTAFLIWFVCSMIDCVRFYLFKLLGISRIGKKKRRLL